MGVLTSPPRFARGGITDPTDIANLGLWLDATDASTFTLSGTTVQEWRDKSGNARHFAQILGNCTRNATIGGATAIAYPGDAVLRASAFNLGNNCTLFAVINRTSGAGLWDSAPNTANVWRSFGSGDQWEIWDNNAVVATGITNSTDTVVTCRVSVAPTRLIERWVDGGSYLSGSSGSSTGIAWSTPQIGRINSGDYFTGNIGEYVIYSAALSDTDRAAVEDYLATKWGTP